ncbi:LacI family DNA-binding transcriptional regulator [Acidothermaceae bacterium B102]|nr:LacI family DNA-binding transcriptional regulator [Acidothermaceae bacterium B102]
MKRPTIGDIAARAGVSKGAVSYALNGQPGVSEVTRQRILTIAEQIGWQPNRAARALSGARADAVGLVIARPARVLSFEHFFMAFISGLEAELSARHIALLLQVVRDHDEEIAAYRRWWAERRVDGVIVVDLHVGDDRVPVLEELALPAVIVGGPDGLGSLPGVWADDAAAVSTAVDYLVALGHERIASVAGLRSLQHTGIRTQALQDAMARHGLPLAEVIQTDYTGEEGAQATRSLLSRPSRPTAIIYDNDVMAVAAIGVAQEMGVDVPRDLSIVGWDDSPLSQLVRPALTALSRDIPAYGAHAAALLLAQLDGRPVAPLEDVAARLIARGSTARAP